MGAAGTKFFESHQLKADLTEINNVPWALKNNYLSILLSLVAQLHVDYAIYDINLAFYL